MKTFQIVFVSQESVVMVVVVVVVVVTDKNFAIFDSRISSFLRISVP